MTPDQQRIAIAKACGRKRHSELPDAWCTPQQNDCPLVSDLVELPDYLTDLNAMHEAEKALNHDNAREYCSRVAAITGQEFAQKDGRALPIIGTILHATAAQRACAFLETLGLWENDSA